MRKNTRRKKKQRQTIESPRSRGWRERERWGVSERKRGIERQRDRERDKLRGCDCAATATEADKKPAMMTHWP